MKQKLYVYFFIVLIILSIIPININSQETVTKDDFYLSSYNEKASINEDHVLKIGYDKSISLSKSDISYKLVGTPTNIKEFQRCVDISYNIVNGEIVFTGTVKKWGVYSVDLQPIISKYDNLVLTDYAWWNSSWQYKRNITIDHNQVQSTLINFPILINISSDAGLAIYAQHDGDDITFINSSETLQLDHEIELFNPTTGRLVAWVEIDTLSSTTDTTIWMYYNNSACTSQQDAAGTWSNGYIAVWHFNNSLLDSTGNGYTLSDAGTSGPVVDGLIAGCYEFQGANPGYLYHASLLDTIPASDELTFEAYLNSSSFSAGTYPTIIAKNNIANEDRLYFRFESDALGVTDDNLQLFAEGGNNGNRLVTNRVNCTIGPAYYCAGVYDATNPLEAHMNNTGEDGNACEVIRDGTASHFYVGTHDGASAWFKGYLDEVRVSSIARSDAWLNTTYNNYYNATDGGFFTLNAISLLAPYPPTNGSAVITTTTPTVQANFSWDKGLNSTRTVIVRNTHVPTTPSDGTEIYNGTGDYSIQTILTNQLYYYKAWSYNSTLTQHFSILGLLFTLTGGLKVNCYDEVTGANLTFDLFVTNKEGTDTYSVTGCTNTHSINVSDCPYGTDTQIIVNATDYRARVYYLDLELYGAYTLDTFLPENDSSELYYLRVVETTDTEYSSFDRAIENATVYVRRYEANFSIFKNVSILKTDANGYVNVYLIPNTLYKIFINKSGYYNKTSDYIPAPANAWGQTTEKTFRIEPLETEYEPSYNNRTIDFDVHIYANNTLFISYNASIGGTCTVELYVYRNMNYTSTLNASYSLAACNNSFWITSINTSYQYEVILYMNFTDSIGGEYYRIRTVGPISNASYNRTLIEEKIKDAFGPWGIGYTNTFLVFLPFIAIILLIGYVEPGLGAIAGGLWLGYINTTIEGLNVTNITEVAAFCCAIGFILLIIHWRVSHT